MSKFYKYAPNVWLAECDKEHEKGALITLTTKYGEERWCEVWNLVMKKGEKFYYSFTRVGEESYAERKARKYRESEELHERKAYDWYDKSHEGAEFLRMAEPIKVGHHSEKWHRGLIEKNWKRMDNSVAESRIAEEKARKAEYWEKKAKEINLSMPESLEFFEYKLEKAKELHKGLKNGTIPHRHCYDVQYANKDVKELTKKLELAKTLWGEQ